MVVDDKKGIFSQVLITEKGKDALRFLWFEKHDLDVPIMEYRLRSHVFGAKSSPCYADYTFRKVASNSEINADVDAVETI